MQIDQIKTIVCYGDSNTYGYNPENKKRYSEDIRWTCQLQRLLGEEYRVISEGCNGRTTVFSERKEKWKRGDRYLRPCLNSHKPVALVLLMLGTNDFKKMFHTNPAKVARGMEKCIRIIQEFTKEKQGESAQILLVSPPHIGADIIHGPFRKSFRERAAAYSVELKDYYKKLAKKYGCHFLDASKYVEFSRIDSLHLTAEAHGELAEIFSKCILKIMNDQS